VKEDQACTFTDGICTVCGYHDPNYVPTTESSPEETTTAEETTAAEQENPDGQARSGNGESLNVSDDAAFSSYVSAVPGAQARTSSAGSATKELYNPIVRPLSATLGSASSSDPWYLQNIKPGKVHLDGMQTLAYCRMRKLDSDIKRTERQRTVLNILFSKVKSSNIATLNALLEEILPQVTTDLSKADIIQIAAIVLPYFSSINLEMHSIPAPGTFSFATINKQAVLTMNQAQNIEALRSWLPF
jgi:hypothetical protein